MYNLEDESSHDAVSHHQGEQPDVGEKEGGDGAGDLQTGATFGCVFQPTGSRVAGQAGHQSPDMEMISSPQAYYDCGHTEAFLLSAALLTPHRPLTGQKQKIILAEFLLCTRNTVNTHTALGFLCLSCQPSSEAPLS